MRLNSLRARMTAAFAAALAALLFLVCVGILLHARRTADQGAEMVLREAAAKARREIVEGRGRLSPVELRELREDLEAYRLAVLLVDARGKILDRSRSAIPPWPEIRGDDWRVAAVPVGTDTLVVGLLWRDTEHTLRRQATVLLLLSAFLVPAAAGGAWLLVGRTLSPIGALSRQVAEASAHSPELRLSAPSEDAEVTHLVATLNNLLARITKTAAARGRFYAAASHELRTPLQALSGHLEVALNKPRDAEAYRAAIDEAHAQTRRLIALVRDLLTLNQLDSAPCPPRKEPVDVADVCERVLFQLRPALSARRLSAATDLPDAGTMVPAPPTHVEMLARNLIENAVKYAAPGGAICVRVVAAPSGALGMEVFNPFPPLPRLNTEQLFEPFFRPDASRNAATGGNGLGLAICRAIATANGWGLELAQEDAGVRAVVRFAGAGKDA